AAAARRGGSESAAGPGPAGSPEASAPQWRIPVLATVAQSGDGIPSLLDAIEAHRAHLSESGELDRRRRERAERRIRDVVDRELRRVAWRDPGVQRRVAEGLEAIDAGTATPYSVAAEILEGLLHPGPSGGGGG
ncbi:MAG TPA: hypothetical protein VE173_02815, partial [Longimicrobiales bacterium]|nr:hypothetical protein [Longimicrobiales bacterium]